MADAPTPNPSLADDIEQWAEADESNARNYSFVTTASTMRERSRDLRAAAARLRKLDLLRVIHVPYDEEVEVWPHHDGHDELFPDCTVEDDCEGHLTTIQVCRECGHDHDGESPVFRLWPCPTIRLLEAPDA